MEVYDLTVLGGTQEKLFKVCFRHKNIEALAYFLELVNCNSFILLVEEIKDVTKAFFMVPLAEEEYCLLYEVVKGKTLSDLLAVVIGLGHPRDHAVHGGVLSI